MGEKFEKSTAQEEKSRKLDEEDFFNLSQKPEGLSNIPEKDLIEFLYSREDLENVIYIFKFISDEERFLQIAVENDSSFLNLDEKEQQKVKRLSQLFHRFLTDMPTFCELSNISLNQEGFFIAYVNEKIQRLDIAWKNKKTGNHLFNKLLENVNTKDVDYPEHLRSYGEIKICSKENSIEVEFSGNASKKPLHYAPGYLKNFEEEFKDFFAIKFETSDIKISF